MNETGHRKRHTYIKRALVLVWVGLLWNVIEAGVAIAAGVEAGSAALLAFGLKSIIELFLGTLLLWQLRKELHSSDKNVSEEKTLRLLGYAFYVLAAYVSVQSIATLAGWLEEPEPSLVGIILVLASAALMTVLYFAKTGLAKKLGSRSLRKEATATLICDLQDLTVLVGLAFSILIGWWWADPLAALILVPFLIKEGREAFQEGRETLE